MSSWSEKKSGNDTIDPYPLIPAGAEKILCITHETYTAICLAYKAFRAFIKRPIAKDIVKPPKKTASRKIILRTKRSYDYEPSNAIHTNTCEYRRWCRVTEWFNQFGENQYITVDSIKMDT